jgi:hypothetical protein
MRLLDVLRVQEEQTMKQRHQCEFILELHLNAKDAFVKYGAASHTHLKTSQI